MDLVFLDFLVFLDVHFLDFLLFRARRDLRLPPPDVGGAAAAPPSPPSPAVEGLKNDDRFIIYITLHKKMGWLNLSTSNIYMEGLFRPLFLFFKSRNSNLHCNILG